MVHCLKGSSFVACSAPHTRCWEQAGRSSRSLTRRRRERSTRSKLSRVLVQANNGTLAGSDTSLNNPTDDEEVSGGAYDRNISDVMPAGQPAALTTLFGLDFINDNLVRIGGVDGGAPEGSPNGGVVTTIGP